MPKNIPLPPRRPAGTAPKNIPLPPRRPADMAPKKEPKYPSSNIPVDPEYLKKLEGGYKTPEKPMVVKKAEGGDVKSSKVMKEDKDRFEDQSAGVKERSGLPVSVYDNGKYDAKASRKMSDKNFNEGLRQSREDLGKEMKKKYGTDEDYSYKFPNEPDDSPLPKGKSYKTKASEAMKRGGSVMKKAKGGMVRGCGMALRGHGKGKMY